MAKKMVAFTREKLRRLKAALARAQTTRKTRDDTFEFDGEEYVLAYAQYLIEYLELTMRRTRR